MNQSQTQASAQLQDALAATPDTSAPDTADVLHIAVLMTCFNRRDKTLRCVQTLWPQRRFSLGSQQVQCQLFVLDNGTDGTGTALSAAFAETRVLPGHPQYYWNNGMLALWQQVLASHSAGYFDYFLWLNDDVQLLADALPRLVATSLALAAQRPEPVGAVVGTMAGHMAVNMADRQSDSAPAPVVATYGGRRRRSKFNPLAFGAVITPCDQVQPCDFINGNLCLIPAAAVQAVGLLSAELTHGGGDFDYGLRLQQAGFGLWVAPGFYGICATNPPQGSVFDAAVPLQQRLAMLSRPNVLPPPAEWRLLVRRHGGWSWPLGYGVSYFRQFFPRCWLYLKQRQLPAVMTAVTPAPRRVLIVQQVFKHYRLAFFKRLAAALATRGVRLTVAFSQAQGVQRAKNDNIDVAEPGFSIEVSQYQLGPLVWQQVPQLFSYDVVVTEQANRHLLNYWLMLRRCYNDRPKLVSWGHGFNHQAEAGPGSAFKAWLKRLMLRVPDAFFAYTSTVADYVQSQGVPASRITVLNNSIDTREFAALVQQKRAERQADRDVKRDSAPPYTLLFCGSLYPDKQLAVLLSVSAELVRLGLVNKLIVLGDGPERDKVTAVQASWLDYRGACFAEAKAAAFAEANLMLNPGLVGLAVLDAFAAGLPLVTTEFPRHSPEIAYLQHGYNGLILPPDQLLAGLIALLQQPQQLSQLAARAANSAACYSLDAMVEAFVSGLEPLLPGAERC